MRILLLAPHPFYQERGTPIAVDLLLRALSERGDKVDVLTFHEGKDKVYPNVTLHRINPKLEITNVPPGFSVDKIVCDFLLFIKMIGLLRRNRYDVIHAVEESVFMAWVTRPFTRIPFIYDLDSIMSEQLVDKYGWLRPLKGIMGWFESRPIKKAKVVVPMCDAIAKTARRYRRDGIVVLKDVSLVDGNPHASSDVENLRDNLGIVDPIVMYVGNLESYQGIQLLLETTAQVLDSESDSFLSCALVVIGGVEEHIDYYRDLSRRLEIDNFTYFIGPKPVAHIQGYMSQADILVSPRTQGVNTPMKIYSYLDSGVPVLATRLPTHTQVLTDDISMLTDATPDSMSRGLATLLKDNNLRNTLSERARAYVKQEHSFESFKKTVNQIYGRIKAR